MSIIFLLLPGSYWFVITNPSNCLTSIPGLLIFMNGATIMLGPLTTCDICFVRLYTQLIITAGDIKSHCECHCSYAK